MTDNTINKNAIAAVADAFAASTATQQADQDIMDLYQMKNDIEHVLHVPDTYIGSISKTEAPMYIFDNDTNKIILKTIEYIPGLYKLYDEALVNSRDHVIRMLKMIEVGSVATAKDKKQKPHQVTYININITPDGTIEVENDGNGIPVVIHQKYNKWIPEMIFTNLRSGANFNKDEEDIIGGKNGFGVKLAFIWSKRATIETYDHEKGLKYYQEIENNMTTIMPPEITKIKHGSGKKMTPYTKITFLPDYDRFKIPEGISSDFYALLKKRAYDISAITGKKVKVHFNGDIIPSENFQQYVDTYITNDAPRVYEVNDNGRWEYVVTLSQNAEFQQISFVNGICTYKGGSHVNYIIDQITAKIKTVIKNKHKIDVKPATIKEQLIIFLRCDIVRPSFDSQSKDYMNSNVKEFGSTCSVSDKFITALCKLGIIETACALNEAKELKVLARKTDGTKKNKIYNIPKLIDATYAGTAKSRNCVLILCEGDSAKTGIISGLQALSDEENKYIGVYPLKGKLMNVRGETAQKKANNNEITELKEILGLKMGMTYNAETINDLRYGKVVLLCDSDYDGSHIKGLCINLFHTDWASIIRDNVVLHFMNTPILKAYNSKNKIFFYNIGEYLKWKAEQEHQNTIGKWEIKYYKGLGTSNKEEWMEYMKDKNFIPYLYNGPTSDEKIDMVFNNKRADIRKEWLKTYDRNLYLDTSDKTGVYYEDFIQYELIHFSNYDNIRSIPNIMDGLKPSLRKILYSAFRRDLTKEIKVSQFSGYVSEISEYHHGEMSLNNAIVGMAQNFVGSNNINLFVPNGQFGTRFQGGKDSASERYIYTYLNPITRTLFSKDDDPVLNYLQEDGTQIEPVYYVPILPLILINGSSGIGTGYSTDILPYNVFDIIQYIKAKLGFADILSSTTFMPYYEGFTGEIKEISLNKYLVVGKYDVADTTATDTIVVTELPVGFWIQSFKEHLETLILNKNAVKDFEFVKSDTIIQFTVKFEKDKLQELESVIDKHGLNGVHKLLKLSTTINATNMVLFDANEKLKLYGSVSEIIDEFYLTRLEYYEKRKAYIIKALEYDLMILTNKTRFINEIINQSLVIQNKTMEDIINTLRLKGYNENNGNYHYLTDMPLINLSQTKLDGLLGQKHTKECELSSILATDIKVIWLNDIEKFEKQYNVYIDERRRAFSALPDTGAAAAVASNTKGTKVLKSRRNNATTPTPTPVKPKASTKK